MNREQEAYIKGVAHSIEVRATLILGCVQALQRNSLHNMPVELVEVNFGDVTEQTGHIQKILGELIANIPQSVPTMPDHCEVCQKTEGPFIRVEVSQDGENYQWLNACSDACLHQITLRWKQTAEIIYPGK